MASTVTIDLRHLAHGLDFPLRQVQAVVELLDEGNTVPFITRYRKDQTGGLDEQQIREIQDRLAKSRMLAERKQTILRSIEAQGKLTEKLAKQILGADTTKRLEDLYLPFKPKKQTLATLARSRGLEELADRNSAGCSRGCLTWTPAPATSPTRTGRCLPGQTPCWRRAHSGRAIQRTGRFAPAAARDHAKERQDRHHAKLSRSPGARREVGRRSRRRRRRASRRRCEEATMATDAVTAERIAAPSLSTRSRQRRQHAHQPPEASPVATSDAPPATVHVADVSDVAAEKPTGPENVAIPQPCSKLPTTPRWPRETSATGNPRGEPQTPANEDSSPRSTASAAESSPPLAATAERRTRDRAARQGAEAGQEGSEEAQGRRTPRQGLPRLFQLLRGNQEDPAAPRAGHQSRRAGQGASREDRVRRGGNERRAGGDPRPARPSPCRLPLRRGARCPRPA